MINCRQSEFPWRKKRTHETIQDWAGREEPWNGEARRQAKNPKALTNPSIMLASFFCALHSTRMENVFMVSELACEKYFLALFSCERRRYNSECLKDEWFLQAEARIFRHGKTLWCGGGGTGMSFMCEAYYHVTLSLPLMFPLCILPCRFIHFSAFCANCRGGK